MKNTRTTRASQDITEDKKDYWMGNHKYSKKKKKKTSRGDYTEDKEEENEDTGEI
jgi:hypothetical protein